MRHITFIRPNLGDRPAADAMEPLVFAILKAARRRTIETTLIDERLAPLRWVPTDLVAMTVETYTARRAYQIAAALPRARHAGGDGRLSSDVAAGRSAAVCRRGGDRRRRRRLGALVADARRRAAAARSIARRPAQRRRAGLRPQHLSRQALCAGLAGPVRPRLPLRLRLLLDPRLLRRPIAPAARADVVAEMRALPRRRWCSSSTTTSSATRDAFDAAARGADPAQACAGRCQITIDVARDERAARPDGAARLHAGADRLRVARARRAWSRWARSGTGVAGSYDDVIRRFHARGIMIYGTFVFGYDDDTPGRFDRAAEFAREQSLLHRQLQSAHADAGHGALRPPARAKAACCTEPGGSIRDYRYGDAIFVPRGMTRGRADARGRCGRARRFYSWRSIARRALRGVADVARSRQDRNDAARQL